MCKINLKYVLPIIKKNTYRPPQTMCRNCVMLGKKTAMAVHTLVVNQQWVDQATLGSSKEILDFSFHSSCPQHMDALLLCLQPKEPHLTSDHAGAPVVMKIYGLAWANPKWTTSCWKKTHKKPTNQLNKKRAFWAGMVSCVSLVVLYLTRAIKGGPVCDLISTTSGMIPLESLKIPPMPPEEKAAITPKNVSHQKGW